jgi:WD40 repeat protein
MSNWPVQTQGGEVNSVATSGSGYVVVAGTYYHDGPHVPATLGTYAYDAGGALLWQDSAPPKTGTQGVVKDQGVYWVAVSRDGQWAASAGGDHAVPLPSAPGVGTVTAYEMSTCTSTTILNAQIGGVNMVALSGNGGYLVAGADATYVFERTGSTFGTPVVLRDQIAATDSVVAVAISDDGKWVIYGTTAGKVVLYATTGALSAPVAWTAAPNHYVKMVAMAAGGKGFAVVTTNRQFAKKNGTPVECHAYFFNLDSSQPNDFPTTQSPTTMWTLNGCDGVMSVAINADGSRVAAVANVKQTTGTSGIVFFFDALSTTPIWVKPTLHGPNSVSTDDAGKQVAVADGFLSPGAFYLFDVYGASVPINGLQANQPGVVSWSIQLSADGKALVAGSDDAKVYYFGVAPATAPAAPTNVRIVT